MSSPVGPYKYARLPDATSWIRILCLEPGVADDPLVGYLQAVLLDSDPQYEATSYCWGATATTHQIMLRRRGKNRVLQVASSLFGMLLRFRLPDETRRIWVDAICIDQMNIGE
jgi:hypothetical protein